MKKLLIGLGALILVILLAALIAPSFIGANRYKGEIAAWVEGATGRKLTIDGDVSVGILPTPYLSLAGVRLANVEGASSPDMLRLKSLALNIAFASLLEGRVRIESLELVEPRIDFERLADGRDNWTFTPKAGPTLGAAGTPSAQPSISRQSSAALPDWLQLDRLIVNNGALGYRDDRTGHVESFGQIDGIGDIPQASNAVSVRGQAVTRGLPISFVGNFDHPGGGAAGLGVQLAFPGAQLNFSGSIAEASGSPVLMGKLQLSGDDLRTIGLALGAADASELLAPLAQKYGLEAALKASVNKVTVADLVLRLGDSEAKGNLEIALDAPTRAALRLTLTSLDLDKWLAIQASPLPARVARNTSSQTESAMRSGTASAPRTPTENAFSLPGDLEADLDATVDALLYKGGVVRQIHFAAVLSQGEVSLKEMRAEFPGSSDLTVFGTIRAAGGKPDFGGNLELASDDLRRFLDWLKIDVSAVPAERLRQLIVTAAVQLAGDQLQLRDIDANVDSSHVVGGATILLQERPAFGASLAIDRFNLDAYLPDGAATSASAGAARGGAASSAMPVAASGSAPSKPLAMFESFDANFRARADEIVYRGERIQGVQLDGTLKGGDLTLRDASFENAAGAKGDIRGDVTSLSSDPKLDVTMELSAPEVGTFLRFVGLAPTVASEKLGPLTLKGGVKGTLDRLALDLDAQSGGGTYKASGSLGLDSHGPAYDLDIDAAHPDLAAFLRGMGYRMPGRQLGDFKLRAKAMGGLDKMTLSGLEAKLGPATVTGPVEISFNEQRPKIVARLDATPIDLDGYLPAASPAEGDLGARARSEAGAANNPPWSTTPFDLTGVKSMDADLSLTSPSLTYGQYKIADVKLAATLSNGVFDLAGLTGKLYDGDFRLTGKLDASADPIANLDMHLGGANLGEAELKLGEVRLTKGALSAAAHLVTNGRTEAALVRGLQGDGSLKMQDGVIKGIDLSAMNERLGRLDRPVDLLGLAQAATSGGASAVKRLDGTFTIKDGVAENKDLVIEADGASGKGQGMVDLPRWNMEYEIAFMLAGASEAPALSIRLKGAPDAPRKFLNANALQEYLLTRGANAALKDWGKGSKSGDAAKPDTSSAGQSPSPESIIQELLKGLPAKKTP